MWKIVLLPFILVVTSCATIKTSTPKQGNEIGEEPNHSVFLIANTDQQDHTVFETATAFNEVLNATGLEKTILMLGNNSVKTGIQDSTSNRNNKEITEALRVKYNFFNSLVGNKYLVPGPNEWDKGRKQGMHAQKALEVYLEEDLELGNLYLPDNGCAGPEEVHLSEDVVLLLINTQWWLHNWDRPGVEDGCSVGNEIEFLDYLDDAIKRNYNKKIIVAGHHGLQSSGRYGGYFPAKTHLFPFTLAHDGLYIPLPVIGSLYVLARQALGGHQDVNHHIYKRMARHLREVFDQHPNLIYVSGHELSMEYRQYQNIHAVNSGTFSKGLPVNSKKAEFITSDIGFGKIDFYGSGDVWLRFYNKTSTPEKPVFEKLLFNKTPYSKGKLEEKMADMDFTGQTMSTFITHDYSRKSNRPGPFGNNYREEWATEVNNIPYIDIGVERGGLEILKKGGGMQTRSLRLEAPDKKQYVLRSVNKYPEKAVPIELRGTFAENLISEQISSSHPYAAFAIPKLATTAGIYHTNPMLVYLPDDPRLGIYRKNFGGQVYLYEKRPDDNWSDLASFGNSDDIMSTDKVLKKIRKDGDHIIDQSLVVKSRLFDILIGDWDRHDDQWRWAKFKEEEDIKLYRPIPRDRDQAFFWSDGWVMKLISHRWGMPKFQGFHHEIRDVAGMCFNARYFDRTFLNEAALELWLEAAREIQKNLTDDIIEESIKELPPEIFDIHGVEIIAKLKKRRDDLARYAEEYYRFLAREVDITGTLKRDSFLIKSLDREQLEVTGYRVNSEGEVKYQYYHRIFKTSETREVRMYGFTGEDIFTIDGDIQNNMKVRIIGGGGEDKFLFEGEDKIPINAWVYDARSNTEIEHHKGFKNRTSDKDPLINSYNRKAFKYNIAAPIISGGYNPDDGLFVGFGGIFQTHGFRKDPFKSKHFFTGTIAPRSASFNVAYHGTFTDVIKKWSVNLNASIFYPSYSDFFYGYGNETHLDKEVLEENERHYALRFRQIVFNPEIVRKLNDDTHTFLIGAGYKTTNIRSDLNALYEHERFITTYSRDLEYQLFDEERHYAGLYAQYSFDTRDNELYPTSGMFFNIRSGYNRDLDGLPLLVDYTNTRTSLSGYYSFGSTLKSTLAVRVGTELNAGSYEIYQASKLGGTANLRGYRKQRFAGDKTFYQNTELRVRLFNFRSILLPGDAGLLFFHDIGRVWIKDDPSTATGKSERWHRGFGFGAFLAPFGKAAISSDFSWSNTGESAVFIRLGFLF